MKARSWGRVAAGAVLVGTMVVAGSSASAAARPDRLTGDDAAHATAAEQVARTPHGTAAGRSAGTAADTAATTAIVPMPDLAITHRLPGGGMNLWRLPISDYDADYGTPQLVKQLNYGGFSYDKSVSLAGDVGDITASDDGTADHVIWHAQPNGGVLLWGVGGGGDPTPQLWADLRTGGWSYANSTPMLGDVTGDGWDDLVVVHATGIQSYNIWVFPSDGTRLGAPQLWAANVVKLSAERYLLADVDGDGRADFVVVRNTYGQLEYAVISSTGSDFNGSGSGFALFSGPWSAGWSFSGSRQLAGDVNGDGLVDLITVHVQAGGGMLVWVHENCYAGAGPCMSAPVVWQNLKTGGWSFSGSRQYIADSDGDGFDDLITVHSQGGNPGELVWRALSTGSGFGTPEIVANLKTGGWNYLNSREKVATLFGQITF